jgi:hypothetical protein
MAAALVVPASANLTNVDFESFALGDVPSGVDTRTPGSGTWYNPDNAATYRRVTVGVGRAGSRGIEIGNRGNGNDSVINNVQSGILADSAGESTTGAAFDRFKSSIWFRTAPTSNPGGIFRFGYEIWGSNTLTNNDRITLLSFQNDTSGNLTAIVFAAANAVSFPSVTLNTFLTWGDWYRVDSEVQFVDGVDNDVVTHRIFEAFGSQVGQDLVLGTWEGGQRAGFNGGNLVAANAMQFTSRNSVTSPSNIGAAAFVDDIRYEAVPEPMTMSVMAMGALAALRKQRQRKA